MSFLLPPDTADAPSLTLAEPLWLPAPDHPTLPVNHLHIWRIRMDGLNHAGHRAHPRWTSDDDCPVSRDRVEKIKTALFRQDVLGRYSSGSEGLPGILTGPAAGLRVAVAGCDHLALIAVSRNVREVGLDLERVRADIPFEEMAGGFLDAGSQWDIRITWSLREKAWKFFQFWTSNEACAQAHISPRSTHACRVQGFSPEADFVAALAIEGGPDIELHYWDWQC